MTYTLTIAEKESNGRKITIVGATHKKETFEKNKEFFENLLSKEGSLVLEGSPLDLIGFDGNASSDANFSNLDKYVSSNFNYFFGKIMDIAKDNGKDVYTVDPLNFYTRNLDNAIFFGVIGAGLASAAKKGYDVLKSRKIERPTRRDFLKGCLKVGIGAGVLYNNTTLGKIVIDVLSGNGEALDSYGHDDRISYAEYDYRNASIAEGIEKIIETKNTNIVSIHGAAHADTVAHYIDNLYDRDTKLALYSPIYGLLGENTIRKYEFQKDEWKEIERIKY